MHHSEDTQRVSGTGRLEAFSDGVFAINVTLLVLELHVPELSGLASADVWQALYALLPKFLSFTFSFAAICVFWVNHYYFFRQLTHTDWPLLWHSCHLLFWLTLVPFTTAFLGDYPTVPLVLSLYAFVMCMAAVAFDRLINHAFFHSSLAHKAISVAHKERGMRRGKIAIVAYAASALLPWVSVWLSWILLLAVPLYYVVPRLLVLGEELDGE